VTSFCHIAIGHRHVYGIVVDLAVAVALAAIADVAAVAVAVLAPFLITRRMRDNSKQIASISMLLAARRVRRDSCDGAQRQHATATAAIAATADI